MYPSSSLGPSATNNKRSYQTYILFVRDGLLFILYFAATSWLAYSIHEPERSDVDKARPDIAFSTKLQNFITMLKRLIPMALSIALVSCSMPEDPVSNDLAGNTYYAKATSTSPLIIGKATPQDNAVMAFGDSIVTVFYTKGDDLNSSQDAFYYAKWGFSPTGLSTGVLTLTWDSYYTSAAGVTVPVDVPYSFTYNLERSKDGSLDLRNVSDSTLTNWKLIN